MLAAAVKCGSVDGLSINLALSIDTTTYILSFFLHRYASQMTSRQYTTGER